MTCQTKPDVILVSCTKKQYKSSGLAKVHYCKSPLFRKMREYAEGKDVPWFILSTKYGLTEPERWIEWYNKEQPDDGWRQWQQDTLAALVRRFGSLSNKVIEIHAGEKYARYGLEAGLLEAGAVVIKPLQGLGQGERQSWYIQHGYLGRSTSMTKPSAQTGGPSTPLPQK